MVIDNLLNDSPHALEKDLRIFYVTVAQGSKATIKQFVDRVEATCFFPFVILVLMQNSSGRQMGAAVTRCFSS